MSLGDVPLEPSLHRKWYQYLSS